jgi:hypothetical protein
VSFEVAPNAVAGRTQTASALTAAARPIRKRRAEAEVFRLFRMHGFSALRRSV